MEVFAIGLAVALILFGIGLFIKRVANFKRAEKEREEAFINSMLAERKVDEND